MGLQITEGGPSWSTQLVESINKCQVERWHRRVRQALLASNNETRRMAPSRERLISSRSNKLGKEDFFVVSSLKGLDCRRSSTHLIQTRSMTKLVYRNLLGLMKRKRMLREQS